MEKNKKQVMWLRQHKYYQSKPRSTIYVTDIELTRVFAKLFIDTSVDTFGNNWNYSHGIYSIENKEKLTNEEIEEITTWLLTISDKDFMNYLRSANDEKR